MIREEAAPVPITVFLSSPRGVEAEREAVKQVVGEMATTPPWSRRCKLTLLAWERVVPPDAGKPPQMIVDDHMRRAGEADIFVCILSHRLGTPVVDLDTGRKYSSGTIYEFYSAYEAKQKHGRPIVMLYRGMSPLSINITNEEIKQVKGVKRFFKQFEGPQAKLEGLYSTFNSTAEFEVNFRKHLEQHLARVLDDSSSTLTIQAGAQTYEQIIRALSSGFLNVLGQLTDVTENPALQPKASKVRSWLSSADTPHNSERILADALTRTIEELRRTIKSEFAERVLGYLNDANSNPAIPQLIAAATLEMIRDDPNVVPPYLFIQLRLNEVHRNQLSSFLFGLRRNLSFEQGYSDATSYANELAGFGMLQGFASRIAGSLDHIARIEAMLVFEFRSRRISDDRQAAVVDYLYHLREHQLAYSPLPLVRAATQNLSGARIKDIFVPIAIRSKEVEKKNREPSQVPEEASPRQSPSELGALILSEQRLVLLGPPGSGKTTLLKRMALAFAEGRSEDVPGWKAPSGVFPIFLRLRSLAAYLQGQGSQFIEACPASIIAYLEHYYREEQRVTLTPDFFDKFLDGGGCGVFMDGLDEVPEKQRAEVANHVVAFISRYGQAKREPEKSHLDERIRSNIFVLTSRPKGYEPVEYFLRSASFAVREVKPLEPAGIRHLLENLLSIIEPDKHQRSKDFSGLCEAILRVRDLTILAGTPLFCTSLVLVYKYHGAELPERRIDVFEEIVDLLLGFWKAQDQKVIQAGRLDEDDGTGLVYIDLGTAVKRKKRRLNHIALQMQLSEKRTEIDLVSLVKILGEYLKDKERIPSEQAATYAERFLITSHERSGLLVETEPSEPPIYAFTHEGFREYLVADALANFRDEKFIGTILDNIDNPTWEEVIVLAGAHPGLSDELREDLLEDCVKAASVCKSGGNAGGWLRRLTMAGRMARDMGEYLSPKDRTWLKGVFSEAMLDTNNDINQRIEIALALDHLGWLTESRYTFVPILISGRPRFFIGKTPVSNQHYKRFLDAPDFADSTLWEDPHCVAFNGQEYSLTIESLFWLRSNEADKRLPASWSDPKFGMAHHGLPVVGVSWYEANAYCRWVQRHWDDLEEARVNHYMRPRNVRLPTEQEWRFAAFEEKSERLPWEMTPNLASAPNVVAYANIGKSLDRTSPIGMFPKGISSPYGLVDIWGNAWEWQANLCDLSYRGIALRGGAFTTSKEDVSVGLRGWRDPVGRDNDLGFRVLIEV